MTNPGQSLPLRYVRSGVAPGVRLLPRLPVHGLPDEVGVTVVPAVFLDHVAEDPAQAGRATIGPLDLGQLRQPAGSKRLVGLDSGTLDRVFPQRSQFLGTVMCCRVPIPVRIGIPVGGVPRRTRVMP